MDISITENFFKELERACYSHSENYEECGSCPVQNSCPEWTRWTEIDLEPLKEWCEEHPRKTRSSEFKKTYPHAEIACKGLLTYLDICPRKLDTTIFCPEHNICSQCMYEYWTSEVD